jgi:hypothetical protein
VHGQLSNPDARVLEHNGAPGGQIIGDRIQIVEQQGHLSVGSPADATSKEDDGWLRLVEESQQGSEIRIRGNQDAFILLSKAEYFPVAGRLHREVPDVNGIVSSRIEPGRNLGRNGVVDEELQEATRRGSSLSRTLSAA